LGITARHTHTHTVEIALHHQSDAIKQNTKMTEPNNKLRKFQRSSNKFHVLHITRRGITMLDELHKAQYRSPKFQPSHILHARHHYNTNLSTYMLFMWKWIHKEKASTCHSVSSCIAVCIAKFIGGIWIWHVRRFPGNVHYHELIQCQQGFRQETM
jgi:hypothetical protein